MAGKGSNAGIMLHDVGVVDVFAGPGGLSSGFKEAGFRIVAAVECDKSSADTYEKNFPEAKVFRKRVEDTSGDELVNVARNCGSEKIVMVAGPPCKPYSTANMHNNKNRGDHPDSSAVNHFVRLIEEVEPVAFLFENVTMFSGMEGWNPFLDKLRSLGYSVSHTKLEAQNFGIPQRRRRLFVAGAWGRNDFDIAALRGASNPELEVRDAICNLPRLPRGGGGCDEVQHPKAERSFYAAKLAKNAKKLFNHWSTRHSEEVIETISHIKPGMSLKKTWNNLPRKVKNRYHKPEAIHNNIYRRLRWKELSPTIVHVRRAMLLHPSQDRILSVREAARLQSFDDTFRFYGGIHYQYQQVANAVPPLLAKEVALHLLEFISQSREQVLMKQPIIQ